MHIQSLSDPGSLIDTVDGATGTINAQYFRGSGTSEATGAADANRSGQRDRNAQERRRTWRHHSYGTSVRSGRHRVVLVGKLAVGKLLVDRDLDVTPHRARLIWSITAAGAVIAAAAYLVAVRTLPEPRHQLPFLLIAAMFAIAEVAVVHVEVGSQTHTYSLVEVPLVLGLLYLDPRFLVLAWLLGFAVTLGVVRRQSPIKLAYNLTTFALGAVIASLLYHSVADPHAILDGATFAAIFIATVVPSLISIASVFLAVGLTEGHQPREERIQHLTFGMLSTAVTTSTMLIGVVLWQFDPTAMWLLALPIFGVYMAQRTFGGQIREQRRLQFLRHSTELVAGLGTEESVTSLLRQICQTLHSDVAALIYLPADLPDSLALAVFGPNGEAHELELVPRTDHWGAWAELAAGRDPRIITQPGETAMLGRLIGRPGVKQAMVVPLCGDLNVIGYLTVADRLSDVHPFSPDDLEVLDTLERFVSMGLENGHLERSLQEARLLERQLVHGATHDALTGLANRTLLADHLDRLLSEPGGADIACLFIDLDDFKCVNDRFGHSVGDQLLVVTAQRLIGCLRDGDMAARLGGDELAVIAHLSPDKSSILEATALGDRIIRSLARQAAIGQDNVATSASVGIVLGHHGESAADLLAAADEAMYSAKAAGKGRVRIYNPGSPVVHP